MCDLKPYREAKMTPLMKWGIVIGSILFTAICFITMPITTLA